MGTPHKGYGRCMWHGGCTPNHVKSAQRQMAADEARRLGLEFERDEQAPAVLQAELRRARGVSAWLDYRLGTGELALVGKDGKLTAEAELWQRERDRARSIAKDSEKLGLERRRVELAEGASRELASCIRRVLERVDVRITPEVSRVIVEEFGRLEQLEMPRELEAPAVDGTAEEEAT